MLFRSDTISQKFETREPTDTQFLDYRQDYIGPNQPPKTYGKIRTSIQNEFNFFVKDDWKITPGFTLNLGLRWDLFQVPYFESGTGKNWTRGLVGGSSAALDIPAGVSTTGCRGEHRNKVN